MTQKTEKRNATSKTNNFIFVHDVTHVHNAKTGIDHLSIEQRRIKYRVGQTQQGLVAFFLGAMMMN